MYELTLKDGQTGFEFEINLIIYCNFKYVISVFVFSACPPVYGLL